MLSITVLRSPVEVVLSITTALVTAVIDASLVMSVVVTVIMSLAVVLAPTWKDWAPAEAPMMALPLKVVPPSTRVTSLASSWNSLSSESLSEALLVALRACTASSRMRCSESPTLPRADSAVCASEMPSLALRIATFMPRTCAFMRSAIARPAASSLAELTRRPEDRRCIEVARLLCEAAVFLCAFSEMTLVLMVDAMLNSFQFPSTSGPDAVSGPAASRRAFSAAAQGPAGATGSPGRSSSCRPAAGSARG